jgi:hypothetical protein
MRDSRKPENLVDLERYPLSRPGTSAYEDLVEKVRASLSTEGLASLPGFLRPDALELMVFEAEALAPLAYPGPTEATPYFFNYDIGGDVDADHPTRRRGRRALSQVAYDLIPTESAFYRLYHWPQLPAFLAHVFGHAMLYRTADAYQSLNISVMDEGGCQQWHFDRSRFVTTLLLQAPESGGEFEYSPNLREDTDEHFERVKAVLDGAAGDLRRVAIEPGMLNLFKGHYSMHRVTEVRGSRRRLQTILAYSPEPNVQGSLKSSILHYGPRVAIRERLSPSQMRALLADNRTTAS